MLITVAYEKGSVIPKLFGEKPETQYMWFDAENGTIYSRTTVPTPDHDAFINMIANVGSLNALADMKPSVFLCDDIVPELEKRLTDAGIEVRKGITGKCLTAVKEASMIK